MSSARRTFLWMGALSAVSLLLGVVRELVIARDLQASGAADLFFRGLVIVGASRMFALSVLRARWIPLAPGPSAWHLARQEAPTLGLLMCGAVVGLAVIVDPSEWRGITPWVFSIAVLLAVLGSVVRVLAERAGLELRGYILEWSLPLGTIAGGLILGYGALGPALGLTVGLFLGTVVLLPAVAGARAEPLPQGAPGEPGVTRWLLVDTLAYVNLGLLDGALSRYIFDPGGFALLNYGYLFVNATLAVPSAAATLVSLRIAGADRADSHARLRRWALVAGVVVAGVMSAVWAALSWAPVEALVDRAAGWTITEAIRPIVLCALPFAALRLANTVGRQWMVAHDPRRLVPYDLLGLGGRAAVLVFGAAAWGLVASPLALAVAEVVQVSAWIRSPHRPVTSRRP